jgi:hypothetical protein
MSTPLFVYNKGKIVGYHIDRGELEAAATVKLTMIDDKWPDHEFSLLSSASGPSSVRIEGQRTTVQSCINACKPCHAVRRSMAATGPLIHIAATPKILCGQQDTSSRYGIIIVYVQLQLHVVTPLLPAELSNRNKIAQHSQHGK